MEAVGGKSTSGLTVTMGSEEAAMSTKEQLSKMKKPCELLMRVVRKVVLKKEMETFWKGKVSSALTIRIAAEELLRLECREKPENAMEPFAGAK
jgi:hypothetical protein